jgi:single-stranded-DNA-specific exonuclease
VQKIVRRSQPPEPIDLPSELHPLLRDVYAARGVRSADELDLGLENLPTPAELTATEEAAQLLHTILEKDGRILVIGDFDADGATSCALALLALRSMGASNVSYLVPNRFEYGYGLTPEIVTTALKQKPDLLITVDNGISSIEGARMAKVAGVALLITDHHLPGEEIPEADVIVNPHLHDDNFTGANLAGVGVIFYVMVALRGRLRQQGWFGDRGMAEPNLAELLDLVALGTVADVVPLDRVNRILVHQGLQRIRSGRCRPGIAALLEVARREKSRVVAADLGFAVAPRLNAAGRLDDISLGIECLLQDDHQLARQSVERLDSLNRERRQIEGKMQQQALAALKGLFPEHNGVSDFGLCVYSREWHQGVIGILAARLRERFHRPVIAFAPDGSGTLKGSARSIPGLHIRDLLDAVATKNPGVLSRFGGHAMAAGLSLNTSDYETFRRAFDQEVRCHLSADDLRGVIYSDGTLEEADFCMELAQQLRSGGPWGQGFPEPVFNGRFTVRNSRIVGERHLKLELQPEGSTLSIDAIAFNQVERGVPRLNDVIDVVYRLDINEYRGRAALQLVIEQIGSG